MPANSGSPNVRFGVFSAELSGKIGRSRVLGPAIQMVTLTLCSPSGGRQSAMTFLRIVIPLYLFV
jgi:hypothetical protein